MSRINDIVERVSGGQGSAVAEVEAALSRAEEFKDHNALISTCQERALKRAAEIDNTVKSGGKVGRLAGVTFVAKDNFLTLGTPTTAAAPILEGFISPVQATAVDRLEVEGAVCIGKANLDSFAHGGSTENSAYGPTKNAIDPTRVAGGSSGGSAAAVALGIVPFSLGSDTGGSIRQPASFNGVIGIKPTYGMVSRYGVVAMASSTDCVGCFAHDTADAEIIMDILAGPDSKDMTTLADYFTPETAKPGQKIGLIKEFMNEGVDQDVKESVSRYVKDLESLGHKVEEVSLPSAKYALAMYYIITPAEISSNLARYDGVRYGKSAEASSLDEMFKNSRGEGFVAENKRRIMIGSYVLSSGFFDAYYLKAQKARTLLIQDFDKLFSSYDALIGPVAPTPAFGIGQNTSDPIAMYMTDIMTVPASMAGLPAISVPAGQTEAGLPIGVQIIGDFQHDAGILALAKEVEESYGR